MNQLILAAILSMLPISELRGAIPVALDYTLKNNISILPIFLLIILLNILVIFIILFFLDYIHKHLLKVRVYERAFGSVLRKFQKKVDNLEKSFGNYGFLALTIFVAIPLPATGAWSGTLIAWLLGLDRKKSILSIALGVIIAGVIVLLASLGILGAWKFIS